MHSIGIDFGTTNTVLATTNTDGGAHAVSFCHDNERLDAVRSTLSFRRDGARGGRTTCDAGPWAIQTFIESPEDTRFLQSFKSFAASSSFADTAVFSTRYKFEDLLSTFLARIGDHGGLKALPKRVVVGRPVRFAGHQPDDALAQARYSAAFSQLGVDDVRYVLEPVAAAHFYAQRLKRDAVVLVGDFGGGTSDFSVIRFRIDRNGLAAEAMGHSGIDVAGDTFDYRIIDNIVSPKLGKNATYRSWGKTLRIPIHYHASFSRWSELCLMNRPDVVRELRDFAKTSIDSSKLNAFVDLIEGGVSYSLYRTVSQVKARLSQADTAAFRFKAPGIEIDEQVKRADFETWIADDVQRLGTCVDKVLSAANTSARGVDRVFLTGGTSYVPAVRRMFEQRFAPERIETGEQLLSIAKGLALISANPNYESWVQAI